MTDTPTGDVPGIDLAALASWAATGLAEASPPFRAELIAGGQSNITARVTDTAGNEYVLRRPPLRGVLPTAHDMGREHRIISALGPTPVPVPEALAFCDDPSVIGAPFYMMRYVPGTVLHSTEIAERALDEPARHASGESLVDALVALHAVDVDAAGLGDFARRDELVRRQLKRWHAQIEASRTRDLAAIDTVHDLLAARVPEQVESTVVHGDFRLGNCIVDARGAIQAVLDWEICTLGDPRADLGYVLATWPEPGDPVVLDEHSPTLAPGFATRDELLARYRDRSGRDTDAVDYFVAFSFWRLACILEGVLSRILQGARGGTDELPGEGIRMRVDRCVLLAEQYAAST